jgi:tetratricopeptide (TPR) repeat protein
MADHLERALVLLEQSRYDLAEKELRQALAEEPDNPFAHAFLASCLNARDQYLPATEEAEAAIRLAPDWAEAHAILARIMAGRNRFDEARQAAEEALRLNPEDPDYHGLLANLHLIQKEWQAALESAERGLALDAEHVLCNNLRAMALTKLGRTEEANATIASTLARAPEDAFSHANQGWNYLHQGNSAKAREHFREALRLDPEMDYARHGMVEALKSKNIVYALMLRYFLLMSRLSKRAQWMVVLGGFIGYEILRGVARKNPALAPYITPILVLYIVFALMTWISVPLFNLLLRLDRFGRHALSRDQRVASNWIGLMMMLGLSALGVWLFAAFPYSDIGLMVAIFLGFLLLPVSAIFNCDRGWPRSWMIVYTLILASLCPLFFLLIPVGKDLALLALQVFLWGSVLSGFVANFLIMARTRI